jgi:hypothetical protein
LQNYEASRVFLLANRSGLSVERAVLGPAPPGSDGSGPDVAAVREGILAHKVLLPMPATMPFLCLRARWVAIGEWLTRIAPGDVTEVRRFGNE